jgi:hypothetical protein
MNCLHGHALLLCSSHQTEIVLCSSEVQLPPGQEKVLYISLNVPMPFGSLLGFVASACS